MNKHISKLLIIILIAVLFVPLFSNSRAEASNIIYESSDWESSYRETINGYNWVRYIKIIHRNSEDGKNYIALQPRIVAGATIWQANNINKESYEENTYYHKIERDNKNIYLNDELIYTLTDNKSNLTLGLGDGNGMYDLYKFTVSTTNLQQPDIISRPILEYPYYIMYCNEDYSWVRMQSYKEIPVFTIGEYRDTNKNEYDIKWVGRGPMIEYNWQIPPGGGAGIEEWVKSGGVNDGEIFTDDGAERKIILETNHAINIDTEHIPPVGQGREISEQDPFFKLISHQDPIETVYDKVRIQVQLGDNLVSAKGMPKELAEIYVNGAEYQIISREWKGYKIDSVGMLLSQYFYNEIITIDLYVPFTIGQYKSINITAVIPEEKQYLLNIRERKEYNLSFQIFRYEFIDEDGDGIDDNTGETGNWHYDNDVPGYSDGQNPPDPGNYDPGILGQIRYLIDTIGYWIMTPFRLLSEGLTYVLEQVNSVLGWASNFSIMIGSLFSFLPTQIVSLISLSFVAIIVITLIKAVRG